MFSIRVPGAGQTHRSFINNSLPKVLPADWTRSAGSFNVCIFASVAKPDEELPLPYGWIALAILTGSQIPFESASPKDEAVSITVSATDRTKSDKNMRF